MTAGWRVETSSQARRDLRRLDPPVRARVAGAINRLGDVIKLQGREEWRLRAGDWRILLHLDTHRQTIVVLRVLPRARAYQR